MFDLIHKTAAHIAPAQAPQLAPEASTRTVSQEVAACLRQTFDEIDYGIVLVGPEGHVLYLNHTARQELDPQHPLQLLGGSLRAGRAQDVAPLFDALVAAQRGQRRLVTLGAGEQRTCVSVVPLSSATEGGHVTLLLMGKRRMCQQLSVYGFARALALTPAETRVLELLCAGSKPADIAAGQQVKISTVRTQISSIRQKAGAPSIRELVRQIAQLPPLVGALRGSASALIDSAALQAA